jgi:hypothetical protein
MIPVCISTFKTMDFGFSGTNSGCESPDSDLAVVSEQDRYNVGWNTCELYNDPLELEKTIMKYIAKKKVRIIFLIKCFTYII